MIDKRLIYSALSTGFSVKGLIWGVPMVTFVSKVAAAMVTSLLIMLLLMGSLYFLFYIAEKVKNTYEYLFEYVRYINRIQSQPLRTALKVHRI